MDIKCAVVECFQRTMQGMIHCHMTAIRTGCFVDVLPARVAHLQLHTSQRLVWWTGSMRSASGSTCIHCLPEEGGRPGSSAPLAHGPGQDEQDPPSVGLRQQGPLVQGDLSCGGHAEHQPLDLRGGRCCRWTYQGNLLRPGNPEGHATGLLWHGCHPGQLPAWEHHTVPDKVGCSKSVNSWESDLVWINGDSVIPQQRCCGQLHQAALSS